MASLTKEQIEKGPQRFLEANPDVKRKIDALSELEADCLSLSIAELREVETMMALREHAKSRGLDSYEYLLRWIADSKEEFAMMKDEKDRAMQKAIGL